MKDGRTKQVQKQKVVRELRRKLKAKLRRLEGAKKPNAFKIAEVAIQLMQIEEL